MRTGTIGNVLLAWLAAVVTATVLGSIVQTQFNLASIAALDVAIPFGTRLLTTAQDIVNFGMLYGVLVAITYVIAFAVAACLVRWLSLPRPVLFMVAGAVGIATLLALLNAALPMAAIAATRSTLAVLLMALAGVPAGLVYLRVRNPAGH